MQDDTLINAFLNSLFIRSVFLHEFIHSPAETALVPGEMRRGAIDVLDAGGKR